MKIQIYLLLILLILYNFFFGDTKTTYQYGDTIIERVDKDGKTTFYYGEISRKSPRIWVKYSGINDGFHGYLQFEEDGKVTLLSGDGHFRSTNIDTTKFDLQNVFAYNRPDLGDKVYFIQLATYYEQKRNLNTGTNVKVLYEKD